MTRVRRENSDTLRHGDTDAHRQTATGMQTIRCYNSSFKSRRERKRSEMAKLLPAGVNVHSLLDGATVEVE